MRALPRTPALIPTYVRPHSNMCVHSFLHIPAHAGTLPYMLMKAYRRENDKSRLLYGDLNHALNHVRLPSTSMLADAKPRFLSLIFTIYTHLLATCQSLYVGVLACRLRPMKFQHISGQLLSPKLTSCTEDCCMGGYSAFHTSTPHFY